MDSEVSFRLEFLVVEHLAPSCVHFYVVFENSPWLIGIFFKKHKQPFHSDYGMWQFVFHRSFSGKFVDLL